MRYRIALGVFLAILVAFASVSPAFAYDSTAPYSKWVLNQNHAEAYLPLDSSIQAKEVVSGTACGTTFTGAANNGPTWDPGTSTGDGYLNYPGQTPGPCFYQSFSTIRSVVEYVYLPSAAPTSGWSGNNWQNLVSDGISGSGACGLHWALVFDPPSGTVYGTTQTTSAGQQFFGGIGGGGTAHLNAGWNQVGYSLTDTGFISVFLNGQPDWTFSFPSGWGPVSFTNTTPICLMTGSGGSVSGELFAEMSMYSTVWSASNFNADWIGTVSHSFPPPDLLGNNGASITPIPTGIAPIPLETCAAITWTDPSTYFPGLFCSFRNAIRQVVNILITVANVFLSWIGWLLDFSKPIDFTPFSDLGTTAKTRFPFSIPFDVATLLNTIFGTSPTAPSFNLGLTVMGTTYHIVFDLSWMSPLLTFVRWGELAFVVVGLGLKYREWSGGGW